MGYIVSVEKLDSHSISVHLSLTLIFLPSTFTSIYHVSYLCLSSLCLYGLTQTCCWRSAQTGWRSQSPAFTVGEKIITSDYIYTYNVTTHWLSLVNWTKYKYGTQKTLLMLVHLTWCQIILWGLFQMKRYRDSIHWLETENFNLRIHSDSIIHYRSQTHIKKNCFCVWPFLAVTFFNSILSQLKFHSFILEKASVWWTQQSTVCSKNVK